MILQTAAIYLWLLFAPIHRAAAFNHAAALRTEQGQQHRLSSAPPISTRRWQQKTSSPSFVVRFQQSNENALSDELVTLMERVNEVFPAGQVLTMILKDHRPLGCTVEESLNEDDGYVFISKLTEGGFADKAGLKVGDVVVGMTGLFGQVTVVMDSGVEKM
jgi:predicted metalloprotease with PDZ domain